MVNGEFVLFGVKVKVYDYLFLNIQISIQRFNCYSNIAVSVKLLQIEIIAQTTEKRMDFSKKKKSIFCEKVLIEKS